MQAKKLIEELNRMNDIGQDRSKNIRLDKNERTEPFEDQIFDEVLSKFSSYDFVSYPDQNPLYKSLSNFLDVQSENILLTPGSDAGIKFIFETFISENDCVGYLWPTYAMIDVYAKMFGAERRLFNFDKNLELDLDEIFLSVKNKEVKALIIANPNQPSGTIIGDSKIDYLIELAEDNDVLIVLDQAYIEFSSAKRRNEEIKTKKNLIITRTFSKGYGIAGLRIGYLMSSQANIGRLYKVKSLSDINTFALKTAQYMIENQNVVNDYIKEVNLSKTMIKAFCENKGLTYIDSETNFIHIKENLDMNTFKQKMSGLGYLLRFNGEGLPAALEDSIRITVGPRKQMKKFLEILGETI